MTGGERSNGAPIPAFGERSGPGAKLRLGGMALRNGLLIHGPTRWAAAVRRPDGAIDVASGRKPVLAPGLAGRAPVLRGPLKLAEAFLVVPLVRMRLSSARLPFEAPSVAAAVAASMVATRLLRGTGPATVGRELTASALGMVPAVVSLRSHNLAAYHGVEHKAIAAYEQGLEDTTEAGKEHDRCGSNLIAPLAAFSVAGQVLLERLVEQPTPVHRAAVGVAGLSAAVEVFAWSERHAGTPLARALRRPGREMQRLFATREPDTEQLEVGRAALEEVLHAEARASGASSGAGSR